MISNPGRCTTAIAALAIAGLFYGASATAQPVASAPAGGEVAVPVAPQAPAQVLYDQTDSVGTNGFPAQNFEPALDIYDSQGADDFVVPPNASWSIDTVFVAGVYGLGGVPPIPNVDVYFYADAAGLPGTQVYSALAVVPSEVSGDLTISLPSPAVLGEGTYWVSVIANLNFGTQGQWFWSTRTVANGNPYAWRNPGNGFGSGCTSWGVGATGCGVGGGVEPDSLFRLDGTPTFIYAPVQEIPTVSRVGIVALVVLLAGAAFLVFRRYV
jgi:hypothetical protein